MSPIRLTSERCLLDKTPVTSSSATFGPGVELIGSDIFQPILGMLTILKNSKKNNYETYSTCPHCISVFFATFENFGIACFPSFIKRSFEWLQSHGSHMWEINQESLHWYSTLTVWIVFQGRTASQGDRIRPGLLASITQQAFPSGHTQWERTHFSRVVHWFSNVYISMIPTTLCASTESQELQTWNSRVPWTPLWEPFIYLVLVHLTGSAFCAEWGRV